MSEQHQIESRVSRLETNMENLVEDIRQTNQNVVSLGKAIETMSTNTTNAITELADKLHSSTQTQWGPMLSFTAIVLVIVGMVGSGYVRDQYRIEDQQEAITLILQEIRDTNATQTTRLDSLDKTGDKMEENLRREIALNRQILE